MRLQRKVANKGSESFSLRVKIGEYEVALVGTHQEVTETIENLPDLLAKINKAFEFVKPKAIATITMKATEESEPAKPKEASTQSYPKISPTENPNQGVLRILESDWGKWRPRTVEEIKQAVIKNNLNFSERVLTSALDGLSKKGLLRRWNTNAGFVYILAEEKTMKPKGEK